MSSKDKEKQIVAIQSKLDLVPLKEAEVDGIEMGVLSDGTPFLTASGLARLCGVARSVIITLGANWQEEMHKPRGARIAQAIVEQGGDPSRLFIETNDKKTPHAYPDDVCMAVLEWYAFEARSGKAAHSYRLLARKTLREFIYEKLQFQPAANDSWRYFHDRVELNIVPAGHFSVFQEVAGVIVAAIQNGLNVDHHTVPDGSVGIHWGKYWTANGLEAKYSARMSYPHVYPPYFPQAKANPEAWIYPLSALGEFRGWLQEVYLPGKFPTYLEGKVKQGRLTANSLKTLVQAVQPRRLTKK